MLGLASLPLQLSGTAYAQQTRVKDFAGKETWLKGTLDGVGVSEAGRLVSGVKLGDAQALKAGVATAFLQWKGQAFVGSAAPARVFRAQQPCAVGREQDLAATALAQLDDTLVVGWTGSGQVESLTADCKRLRLQRLGDETQVWAFVRWREQLLALTGPAGEIWRVDTPQARRLARWGKGPLLSAVPGAGAVYVGTAVEGRVLRFTGGKLRAFARFTGDEVVGLTTAGSQTFVAVNDFERKAGDPPSAAPRVTRAWRDLANVRPAKVNGRSRLYLLGADGAQSLLRERESDLVFGMQAAPGDAVWLSDSDGSLRRVSAKGERATLARLRSGAAVGLSAGAWLAARPARALPFLKEGAARWRSEVVDLGQRARLSRLEAWGAPAKLRWRVGDTETLQSAWRVLPKAGALEAAGRFVQFELLRPSAQLAGLRLLYTVPNRRPEISTVKLKRKDDAAHIVNVEVEAKDPDDDTLRLQVAAALPDGSYAVVHTPSWLDKLKFEWDTRGWPEGAAPLRIRVGDHGTVPAPHARFAERQSDTLFVDSSPPQLSARLRASGYVEGVATDTGSRIRELAYALDGEAFVPLLVEDGVCDTPRERFKIDLRQRANARLLRLRATDEAGNHSYALLALTRPLSGASSGSP